MTSGVETRNLRGAALLDAIAKLGADSAFTPSSWRRSRRPDLIDLLRDVAPLRLNAEKSRQARVRAYEAERRNAARRDLRFARAEGTAPAPKPRRRKAEPAAPVEISVPEVVESAEAPLPDQAPVPADGFDIAAALQSPEAKAEAAALYREWNLAGDHPHEYLQKTVTRLLRDFDSQFPTLARIDAAGGGRYGRTWRSSRGGAPRRGRGMTMLGSSSCGSYARPCPASRTVCLWSGRSAASTIAGSTRRRARSTLRSMRHARRGSPPEGTSVASDRPMRPRRS